jgi:hypothetical protein
MITTKLDVGARNSDFIEFPNAPPKFALTIREFCNSHNISPAFFYLLRQRGEGPRIMHVGSRRLISIEEARRWREARTAAPMESGSWASETLR